MEREKKFTLKSYLELRTNISSNLLQGAMTYDEDMYNYYLGMWKIIKKHISKNIYINSIDNIQDNEYTILDFCADNNIGTCKYAWQLKKALNKMYFNLVRYEYKYYDKLIGSKEV